jgi:hypothetical protein
MTIPAGFYEATINFQRLSGAGSAASVVFGGQKVTTGLTDTADAVAAAIVAEFNESFAPDVLPALLVVRDDVAEAGRVLALDPNTGTAMASPATCVLVAKQTAHRGRANKGRMFLPGLLQDSQVENDGTIPSGQVTGLQTAFTAFLGQLSSNSVPMYILHKSDPTLAPSLVESLTVRPLIATQRRRLRK